MWARVHVYVYLRADLFEYPYVLCVVMYPCADMSMHMCFLG